MTARVIRLAIGALLVLVGLVWVGQGVGLIEGSFMTGEAVWAVIGAVCLALGAMLLVTTLRASSREP
jgi:uncharacterized membrane protein YcjF (UPF0283 family)